MPPKYPRSQGVWEYTCQSDIASQNNVKDFLGSQSHQLLWAFHINRSTSLQFLNKKEKKKYPVYHNWEFFYTVVSWGVGVETLFYGHYLGYYLICVACATTFLEFVFLINYCVQVCFSPDTCCVSLWNIILKLDDWKKGFFYVALSVLCFLHPVEVWLAIIPGIMLVLNGFFYILKTFKTLADKEKMRLAQRPSYDKFDDLQDDLEIGDTVLNPHGTISIMNDETLAEQQDILEC